MELPPSFAPGFDPDADLLAQLQRLLAPLGTLGPAVFPEWYASYVYVGVPRTHGDRWVLCNKYRPVVAVSTVEPSARGYPTVDGFVTDEAIRAALAPSFCVLAPEELARPIAEIPPASVTAYERPYREGSTIVAELLFNNLD